MRLVFVHGFWHGSWCWSEVIIHLAAAGRAAVAVDMAGHGLRARRPRWFTRQPYDPEAVSAVVVALDASHSPFLSMPSEVARIVGELM